MRTIQPGDLFALAGRAVGVGDGQFVALYIFADLFQNSAIVRQLISESIFIGVGVRSTIVIG